MAFFTDRCHQYQMQQSRRNCDMNISVSPDNVNYKFFPLDHQRKNSPLPPPPPPSSSHASEFRSGGLCVPQDRIEDVFQLFPSFEDNVMSLDGLLLPPSRDSWLRDSKTDRRVHAHYPRNDRREVIRHYWTESTVAKGRRTGRRRPGVPAPSGIDEEVVTFGPARKRKPLMGRRQCAHCQTKNTPQWRAGPSGPNTLCNACGMRYKSGKLVPEYRPAASPTFNCAVHSNFHKRILRMKCG